MKKLLSVLLCVLMMAMLVPSAMAAAEFPEKEFDFSENTEASHYGTLGNIGTSTITVDQTGGIDGGAALKLNFGGSNANINFLDPTNDGATPSAVEVKFNFKTSVDNIRMKFVLNEKGEDSEVLYVKNNTAVKFLGQTVIAANKLSKDTWYDVEMLIDIEQGYGRLRLKKNADSAWQVFHVFGAETAATSGGLKDMTCTKRLGIGVMDSAGTVYIDNYSQKLATDVKPALLDADDFSGALTWLPMNIYVNQDVNQGLRQGISFGNIDGKLTMTATAENTGNNNSSIYKTIDTTATTGASADTNYIFKFKFGGTSNGNIIGASLATGSTETWLVKVNNNRLNMFTALSGTATTNANFNSFGEITGDTLYDAEAVYNPQNGKLRVAVMDATGKQVSASATLSGAPTKFAFRNHASSNVASTAYFDDFESGVLTGAPEFVSSTVASGEEDAASLDETAIFTYDRTILQSELAAAEVKLNNEVLINDVDYTITSNGNQVMVTLKDLAKDTYYTVELTGVKDLAEVEAEEAATATFHTVAKDVEATQPVINVSEKTFSTDITSYYAQGKKVKLITALYNSDGTKLENVEVKEVIANDREGQNFTETFDILGSADGKKVMGFVWSDFDTMIPYAAAHK